MNEIMGPAKRDYYRVPVEQPGASFKRMVAVNGTLKLRDAEGNEITADQINALLAKCDSLMAIARAAKELQIKISLDEFYALISAHEQKYGPIGGE